MKDKDKSGTPLDVVSVNRTILHNHKLALPGL